MLNKTEPDRENIIEENSKKSIHIDAFEKFSEGADLNDLDEVDVLINQMYENGCRPIVSVSKTDAKRMKRWGMAPRISWIKEAGAMIVGTMGKSPYHPQGQERDYFILNVSREKIRARYTGEDSAFHGVVYLGSEKIAAEDLEPIELDNDNDLVESMRGKVSQL